MIKNAGVALLLLGCQGKATPDAPFQGIVEFEERVVAFEVAGRIDAVHVRRGQVVKPGDVLAQLDDTLERLGRETRKDEVNAAKADLALLQAGARPEDMAALAADVRAASANEDLAAKARARVLSLLDAGAIPAAELDRTEADALRTAFQRRSLEDRLASLRSGARPQEISRARARLEATTSSLALTEERIARYTLRAKHEGSVVDVHVDPGELATVGTPALTMADTAHPYADVFVPQGELHGVQIGTRADVRVDAEAEALSGVVEHVSPKTEFTPKFVFSERERPHLVVRVRVRIEDPARKLHAGVPAFVRLSR